MLISTQRVSTSELRQSGGSKSYARAYLEPHGTQENKHGVYRWAGRRASRFGLYSRMILPSVLPYLHGRPTSLLRELRHQMIFVILTHTMATWRCFLTSELEWRSYQQHDVRF